MKKKQSILFSFLQVVFLFGQFPGFAQELKPAAMLEMKGHMVVSSANKKTYQLFVSLPAKYKETDSIRYPVLYVLDGILSFPLISMRNSMDFGGDILPVIIVAIGDSLQNSPTWLKSRWTDYTPSRDLAADSNSAKIFGFAAGDLKSGGADLFLATLRNDILPFVDKTYKTTNDRGISGHSLGGLFAAWCLLNATDIFQRLGINSPSFWWNKKEMLSAEEAFSRFHSSLPVRVFISVGGLELGMVPDMNRFVEALKMHNYNGMKLTSQVFENETHTSIIPASLSRTLRVLYGKNSK